MITTERLTERAKAVMRLSQDEAERSRHSYIGTEHLLLGLLREGESLAARALRNLGVEIDKVRTAIESVLGRNERIIIQQIIPTSRVKKIHELAYQEAIRMGLVYIGPEHLLLALLDEGEGIGAHVLADLGVTPATARRELDRLMTTQADERVDPAALTDEGIALALREEARNVKSHEVKRDWVYYPLMFEALARLLMREKQS